MIRKTVERPAGRSMLVRYLHMRSVLDKWKFEARSGHGCSNSDYRLQRTTCCGSFAVEDTELQDLYIDPNDLNKFATLLYDPRTEKSPVCPFCGATEWDMVEVTDAGAVPEGWRCADNQTLQWTGPALSVVVKSMSSGAVPAIERWSVMSRREGRLETDGAAYAKGVEAAKADIAADRLQYRWHGHSGHWGHWIVTELEKRFGVGVDDGFGVCFVSEFQVSFDDGYNAMLATEINRRHGEGAFEAVFAESRKQSEEALGDAKRAWLDRHGEA